MAVRWKITVGIQYAGKRQIFYIYTIFQENDGGQIHLKIVVVCLTTEFNCH